MNDTKGARPARWQPHPISKSPFFRHLLEWRQKRLGVIEPNRLLTVGWAVIVVIFLVFAIDSLVVMPRRDSSVFIYVAEGILNGQLPYLDRWDHKGPLIYLLNVIGLTFGGVPGIWLLGAMFLVGASWFAFKLTKEAFGATAAFCSLALFLIYFDRVSEGGNLTESYALLFQFLALLLFVRMAQRNGRNNFWLCVAIGALGAATLLLRANLIGVWIAVGGYWIIQRGEALKYILYSVVGGLAVLLLASVTFTIRGGGG